MSKNNSGATTPAGMVRVSAEALTMIPIEELVPYANNAKRHSAVQISQIRASLREFGFVAPVLIDENCNIIAGHGRVEAARAEGMHLVPCVVATGLTEAQRKAYILADNRLTEAGEWDSAMLEIELKGLTDMGFDTKLTGFDFGSEVAGPVYVNGYHRAAPGLAEPVGGPDADDADDADVDIDPDDIPSDSDEYLAFIEKFRHKKTPDDCYTPAKVYDAVLQWAVEHYHLEDKTVVRPFFPGGDYENFPYPDDCVVIDNPPFSILSQICDYYMGRGIKFFLFAPSLTLFSTAGGRANYLPIDVDVTYENGARVNTSFVTNMGDYKIEMDPQLCAKVRAAATEARGAADRLRVKHIYPVNLLRFADIHMVNYGGELRLRADEVAFVRALDSQKGTGFGICGAGFLLSDQAAERKKAAEAIASVNAAKAEAAPKKWSFSERELKIIQSLK